MLCAQHVRNGFLGRRLARRPGHRDQRFSPQPADGGGEPLQCEKRVLHGQKLVLLREPRALVLGNDNADSEYPPQSNWNGNGNSGALNTYNLKVEKGLSQYDIPHRVVLSYTYQLPFGKGKRFANRGGVVNAFVGGWQFAGVQTYQSGTPLSVSSPGWDSGIFAGNLGANSRPNMVPGQNPNGYHGGGWVWGQSRRLNPAAFTLAPNFTFGDAPRALTVREFASHAEDLSFSKQIPMYTERVKTI